MRRVAWLYQAQGDLANARTWLERVIARLPNDLNAQLNLALIDAQEGRRVQALERMRALKFHHPDSPALDHVLSQLERG
jgi:Tfp pilus assembly protein PilF